MVLHIWLVWSIMTSFKTPSLAYVVLSNHTVIFTVVHKHFLNKSETTFLVSQNVTLPRSKVWTFSIIKPVLFHSLIHQKSRLCTLNWYKYKYWCRDQLCPVHNDLLQPIRVTLIWNIELDPPGTGQWLQLRRYGSPRNHHAPPHHRWCGGSAHPRPQVVTTTTHVVFALKRECENSRAFALVLNLWFFVQ